MALQLTTQINPRGATAEQRQADLIALLQRQNVQLRIIIQDLYKEHENTKTELKNIKDEIKNIKAEIENIKSEIENIKKGETE